jgi:PhnB protein
MAQFNPYLHFLGNTEEAFNFYRSILGGEFTKVMRYKDLPESDEFKIPEEHLDKILLITLPIGHGNFLMGSDALMEREGHPFTFGDNLHIAISADSMEEAERLFNGLAAGGAIEMPLSNIPEGTCYGMLADQFGVQWTVEFGSSLSPSGASM